MQLWTRRITGFVALAATLVALAAPAFAACPCGPRGCPEMRACGACHGDDGGSASAKITRRSCCTTRAVVATPAVSPTPIELGRPDAASHAVAVPVAGEPSAAPRLEAFHSGESPPAAPPPPYLTNFLRL